MNLKKQTENKKYLELLKKTVDKLFTNCYTNFKLNNNGSNHIALIINLIQSAN